MPRANLSQLLGNVEDKPETAGAADSAPQADKPAAPIAPSSPALKSDEAPSTSPARAPKVPADSNRVPASKAAEVEPGAAYLRFVRKETRLRDDQQNALTLHARRLTRARATSGPRITENSLIRIAVDLLLARIHSAEGSDEASILRSLNQ